MISHTDRIVVRHMHDAHLINALLKALTLGDTPEETRVLAGEVKRRRLEDRALAEAERRERRG